jgi:serine/threonine-protein kinase ATR
MLLDHINKWVRLVRQEVAKKAEAGKRVRGGVNLEEQLLQVDSILSNIDETLMAKAAFKCKAFARSLMNFEQRIVAMKERGTSENQIPDYYEKLHEIYAQLDEPDGMEGVSTLILAPTLEHQIREHESTGRWTSAQSCWEVRLQESPDDVEFHLGLLRCLRNLGHYGSFSFRLLSM